MNILLVAHDESAVLAASLLRPLRVRWDETDIVITSSGDAARISGACYYADIVVLCAEPPFASVMTDLIDLRGCCTVPIVVSASGISDEMETALLENGADTVLSTNFSDPKFMATIRANLVRAGWVQFFHEDAAFVVGDLTFPAIEPTVKVNGYRIRITPTEYRILKYLAEHVGVTVESEQLMEMLWGVVSADGREALKVHVSRLRTRLRHADSSTAIRSVRSRGYVLVKAGTPGDWSDDWPPHID